MIKRVLLVLLFTIPLLYAGAQQVDSSKNWVTQIDYLQNFLVSSHKNIYHTISKKQFDSAFTLLRRNIRSLNRQEIIVRMAHIIASIRDGHTRLQFFRPEINFHKMPVDLYYFEDGIYIQSIDTTLKWAAGAKVLKVGNLDITEAFKKVCTVTSADNSFGLKEYAVKYMSIPEVLYALGISSDSLKTSFTIETRDKQQKTIYLKGEAMPPATEFLYFEQIKNRFIKARDKTNHPAPLYLQNATQIFSSKILDKQKIMYVQVNEVRNEPQGLSLPGLFKKCFAMYDSAALQKFVLDLRLNRGGDASILRPIIHDIIKHPKINTRGNFFVITGRRTFSAAGQFVTELTTNTNVILVGEPTGTGPNRFGETGQTNLPNSKISVTVSTQWIQRGAPEDLRKFFGPELFTPLYSKDYENNIDPCLEAIQHYAESSTVYQRLLEKIEQDTITLQPFHELFNEIASNNHYKYYDFEIDLQRLALTYLRKNLLSVAENVLLNAEKLSTVSADTYEILSTISDRQANREKTIRYLQKAIWIATGYQKFELHSRLKSLNK